MRIRNRLIGFSCSGRIRPLMKMVIKTGTRVIDRAAAAAIE